MNNSGLEIEYKFLIEYPDTDILTAVKGCRTAEIVQTYLVTEPGATARVRSWTEKGKTTYFSTVKRRVSSQTAEEHEREISKEEYDILLADADTTRSPIRKTRYTIPYHGHDLEIDVYPFWNRQAVLEIEISEEGEKADIPPYLSVIRDVTGDKRYKNHSLAKSIPPED